MIFESGIRGSVVSIAAMISGNVAFSDVTLFACRSSRTLSVLRMSLVIRSYVPSLGGSEPMPGDVSQSIADSVLGKFGVFPDVG